MKAVDIWRGNRPRSLFASTDISGWPFSSDMESMFEAMERILSTPRRGMLAEGSSEFFPTCDIEESERAYQITLDLPGISRDDIDIEVVGRTVKISGERKYKEDKKGKNRHRWERSYGKFSRIFTLPEEVKADDIEAHFANGELMIYIPKEPSVQAKHIAIKEAKSGQGFFEKVFNKDEKQST